MPVIEQASKASVVNACIATIWQHVKLLKLMEDMRAITTAGKPHSSSHASMYTLQSNTFVMFVSNYKCYCRSAGTALQDFTDMLLKVGDGTYPTEPSLEPGPIRIPDAMVSPSSSTHDFIMEILGDLGWQSIAVNVTYFECTTSLQISA